MMLPRDLLASARERTETLCKLSKGFMYPVYVVQPLGTWATCPGRTWLHRSHDWERSITENISIEQTYDSSLIECQKCYLLYDPESASSHHVPPYEASLSPTPEVEGLGGGEKPLYSDCTTQTRSCREAFCHNAVLLIRRV